MTAQPQSKFLPMTCLVVIIAVIGYYVLNAPDERNGVQKLGDAIAQLPNGTNKAARELKDRTPGDRLTDAAKDESDKLGATPNQ